MIETLEKVYASAGDDMIIDTIQLSCLSWDESLYLVQSYDDIFAGVDGAYIKFTAVPISISQPKRNNKGSQSINFAVDNVTGQAQRLIDKAVAASEEIILTFRRYLQSDLSEPAERPFVATVLGGSCAGSTVQIEAGFQDILNFEWPRDLYTSEFAPQIKYLT